MENTNETNAPISDTGAENTGIETNAAEMPVAEETPADVQAAPNESAEADRNEADDARLRAHFDSMQAQAAELRRIYPGFDLNRELSDPNFFRWTSPAGGLTVKQAYMALHGDDILAAGMKYALEQGQKRTVQSIQASQARPREGGLNSAAGIALRVDPTALTDRERKALRDRVMHGEKIVF